MELRTKTSTRESKIQKVQETYVLQMRFGIRKAGILESDSLGSNPVSDTH